MLREVRQSQLEAFQTLNGQILCPRLTPMLRSSLEGFLETQNGADISLEESYALTTRTVTTAFRVVS